MPRALCTSFFICSTGRSERTIGPCSLLLKPPIQCSKPPPALLLFLLLLGDFGRSTPRRQCVESFKQISSFPYFTTSNFQCLSFKQDSFYMTLQPNYTPHLCNLSTKQNKSFDRNISQYPSSIIISEKGKPSQKQTSRWFLYSFPQLCEYVIVSVLLAVLPHLRRPLSSPILITNGKTKRQSLRCMMRPVFGGSTRIVLASEQKKSRK